MLFSWFQVVIWLLYKRFASVMTATVARNSLTRRLMTAFSRCLRPGSGAFFKDKCLFTIFLATMMKLKRSLAHGKMSPSLIFLSDSGISCGHVTCHVNCQLIPNVEG